MDEYIRKVKSFVRNHDGDSLWLEVDTGFRAAITESFRLYKIDAPEKRGDTYEAGIASRDYLNSRVSTALAEKRPVFIKSYKPYGAYTRDKFGRWLCEIFVDGVNVNQEMIEMGLAVPYDG